MELIVNGQLHAIGSPNFQHDLLTILTELKLAPEVKCGGIGQCGDCMITIKKGAKFLTPLTLKEKQLLGNVFYITKKRLACQCKITTLTDQIEITV